MGTSSSVSCPSCLPLSSLAFTAKITSIHKEAAPGHCEVSGNLAISGARMWLAQVLFGRWGWEVVWVFKNMSIGKGRLLRNNIINYLPINSNQRCSNISKNLCAKSVCQVPSCQALSTHRVSALKRQTAKENRMVKNKKKKLEDHCVHYTDGQTELFLTISLLDVILHTSFYFIQVTQLHLNSLPKLQK